MNQCWATQYNKQTNEFLLLHCQSQNTSRTVELKRVAQGFWLPSPVNAPALSKRIVLPMEYTPLGGGNLPLKWIKDSEIGEERNNSKRALMKKQEEKN